MYCLQTLPKSEEDMVLMLSECSKTAHITEHFKVCLMQISRCPLWIQFSSLWISPGRETVEPVCFGSGGRAAALRCQTHAVLAIEWKEQHVVMHLIWIDWLNRSDSCKKSLVGDEILLLLRVKANVFRYLIVNPEPFIFCTYKTWYWHKYTVTTIQIHWNSMKPSNNAWVHAAVANKQTWNNSKAAKRKL